MLKLNPYISEKIWGCEKWFVSTHKKGESTIDKSVEFIGGKKLSSIVGSHYPVLVKVIEAKERLSIQVHPDDEYANDNEDDCGKSECWYVLSAQKGASLVCGIKKECTKEMLKSAIENNTIEGHLRFLPVEKGDFVYIPSGTVHAINGGVTLLEIQETSDITYRLYDWDRGRELHVKKSLDVIKPNMPGIQKNFNGNFSCEHFKLEKRSFCAGQKIVFGDALEDGKGSKSETPAGKTGWVSFFVLEGSATLCSNSGERLIVKENDAIMTRVTELITVEKEDSFSIMKIM